MKTAGRSGNRANTVRPEQKPPIPESVLQMAPKPVIGFCELFYHYTRHVSSPDMLLHLLKHVPESLSPHSQHYIDSVLWIMESFPSVTIIHTNIVDILITFLYSGSTRVWEGTPSPLLSLLALFKQTWILEIIYQAITTVFSRVSLHA